MKLTLYTALFISLLILKLQPVLGQPGPFKNLRYDDDFSFLLEEGNIRKGTQKLKYINYNPEKGSFIAFGGEIREWYELRKNVNFGDVPPGTIEVPYGAVQHRLMLHTDWHLNTRIRLFVQLNNTLEFWNPNQPIPEIITDGLGIHQAFIDINLTNNPAILSTIRIGRQELNFGNELLISSREGPNNRLPFDGISYIINTVKHKWHFLLAVPVIINPDIFDNTHVNEAVWGAYSELSKDKAHKIDAYYFGFYSERRQFNYEAGDQLRHTGGIRFFSHGRNFFYDLDLMYQIGSFNNRLINAANFTGEVRYIFTDAFLKPMVGLGASYVTGDYNPNDGQLNTFDPMYPKPVYGLATPQGPSNISHIRPTIGIQPTKMLYLNFRWYWLARASNKDGTYTPGMDQVRPLPGISSDKYGVATQYNLDAFYIVNSNLTLLTFISLVKPGAYVKETGVGGDTFFLAVMAQYKF